MAHPFHSIMGSTTDDFVRVSGAQIDELHEFYKFEPLLHIVASITSGNLLGGGVHFSREGGKFTPSTSAFLNAAWTSFVRNMLQQMWTVGFAVVTTRQHVIYGAIPSVVELSMVSVSMKRFLDGHTEYRLESRSGTPTPEDTVALRKATVFDWDPPSANGDIDSIVLRAMMARRLLAETRQAYSIAMFRISNPPVLTEMVTPATSTAIENMAMVPSIVARGGHSVDIMSSNDVESMRDVRARSIRLNMDMGANALNEDAQHHVFDPTNPYGSCTGPFSTLNGMPNTPHVPLATGRRLVHQLPAREPSSLNHVQLTYEERVSSLFGVPHSFLSNASKARSGGDDSTTMWQTSQRLLKQRVSAVIIEIFVTANGKTMAENDLLEQDEKKVDQDFGDGGAACNIQVSLPGLPPRELLPGWWEAGILKPAAFIKHLSTIYGIPESDLIVTGPPTIDATNLLSSKVGANDEKTSTQPKSKASSAAPKPKSTPAPKPKSSTSSKSKAKPSASSSKKPKDHKRSRSKSNDAEPHKKKKKKK
jgi:hypothetical protein